MEAVCELGWAAGHPTGPRRASRPSRSAAVAACACAGAGRRAALGAAGQGLVGRHSSASCGRRIKSGGWAEKEWLRACTPAAYIGQRRGAAVRPPHRRRRRPGWGLRCGQHALLTPYKHTGELIGRTASPGEGWPTSARVRASQVPAVLRFRFSKPISACWWGDGQLVGGGDAGASDIRSHAGAGAAQGAMVGF